MQTNGNAMTGTEHSKRAEWLLKQADGQESGQAAYTIAKAQVHATLALAADKGNAEEPPAEDFGAAIVEAHKIADRIVFEIDESASKYERHSVDMWHGLSVKTGRGATPEDALTVAYAKLTAYLADDAS
jgi:hypothetical protein